MIMGDMQFLDDDYEPDEDETVMVAAVKPLDMIREFQRDIMIGLIVFEDLFPEMPFYRYLKENGVLSHRDEFDGLCSALSIVEACFGSYLRAQDDGDEILKSIFDEVNERVKKIGVTVDMDIDNARNLIDAVNGLDQIDGLDKLLIDLGVDPEGDDEVDP